MALRRNRQLNTAASVPVRAAAGSVREVGAFYSYSVGAAVERASTVPTLSRAQNLLVSMIAGLDLRQYTLQWTGEDYEEIHIPGESWMTRPDPRVTRQFFIGNLVGDLFWYGRAFAYITSRYSNGYPASFTWLPSGSTSTPNEAGPFWYGHADVVQFNGNTLDTGNVLQFIMPTPGLLWTGVRAIETAIRLDRAVRRASDPIASGYLQQVDGEPMTGDELSAMAAAWIAARAGTETAEGLTIGALNQYAKFVELSAPPSLVEHREQAALELSRAANIPPYILGIATGGMTYQNAQEAVRQLYLFGARPIIDCIQETFSLDTVLPRGRHVRFDLDDILIESALKEAADDLAERPADAASDRL